VGERRLCVVIVSWFLLEEICSISRELMFCLEFDVASVSREDDVAVNGGPVRFDSSVGEVLEVLDHVRTSLTPVPGVDEYRLTGGFDQEYGVSLADVDVVDLEFTVDIGTVT